MGTLQLSPFRDTAVHLGYPAYFMSILGAWYVMNGLVINCTGAAVSHIWVGDDAQTLLGPMIFLGLTAASWALRPPERRDFHLPAQDFTRGRAIVYWIATVSVVAELAVGGVWDLLRIDYVRGVVEHLGYSAYLLTIMGIWKVPGAVALLMRRFPRLTVSRFSFQSGISLGIELAST